MRGQRIVLGTPRQGPRDSQWLCRCTVICRQGAEARRCERTDVDGAGEDCFPAGLRRRCLSRRPLLRADARVSRCGRIERSEQRNQAHDQRDQRRNQAACRLGHLKTRAPHLGSSSPGRTGRANRPLLTTDIFVTQQSCDAARRQPDPERWATATSRGSAMITTRRRTSSYDPLITVGGRQTTLSVPELQRSGDVATRRGGMLSRPRTLPPYHLNCLRKPGEGSKTGQLMPVVVRMFCSCRVGVFPGSILQRR